MTLFYTTCFIVAIIVSNHLFKSYINPISIFVGVNLGSLILMSGTSIIQDNLSDYVIFLIFTMVLSFCIGVFLPTITIKITDSVALKKQSVTDLKRLKKIIIFYSIIFDIFAIYYLIHLETYFGLKRILISMSELNAAIQSGAFITGIYTYFTPIGVPLSLMILYYLRKTELTFFKKLSLKLQYFLCYIPCISPRRDLLFMMLTMTFLFYITQSNMNYIRSKKLFQRFKRLLILTSIIFTAILIMSYTQVLMNKSVSDSIDFSIFGIKAPNFLKDPIVYYSGNYPYLEHMYQSNNLNMSTPFISTFRLFYRYFSPIIGINIDTDTDFILQFYNIGSNTKLLFNTVPIIYYITKDVGLFFPLSFISMGYISKLAFNCVQNKKSIGRILLGLFQYNILFFSFRSYNMIFLNHILVLLYMFVVYKYVDVLPNSWRKR